MSSEPSTYTTEPNEISQVLEARHADPFGFLGLHKNPAGIGLVLRVFRPGTARVIVIPEGGSEIEMTSIDPGGVYEHVF